MAISVGYENGSSNLGNIPVGYYYYVIPKDEVDKATYLGFVDTIQNLTYNPFIELEDITTVIDCPFEKTRFGEPYGGIPKCYAVRSFDDIDKSLFFMLNNFSTNGNEDIRLQGYPYKYYLLTDYMNPPLLIKPELVDSDEIEIKVRTTPLSVQAKYNLYVKNYKGDRDGNLEGIVNSNSYMLPVASSVYSQFMATSQASYNQNIQNLMLENDKTLNQSTAMANLSYRQNTESNILNTVTNLTSNTISALSGNVGAIGSAIGSGISGNLTQKHLSENRNINNEFTTQNWLLNEYEITANKNAKMRDMLNTPLCIKSSGNDTLFNLRNSRERIDLIEYELLPSAKNRLSNYFKRYGYKYNRYTQLGNCVYARPHYNYVKTHVANIPSEKVPHKYLEEIKSIFNRGITLWHMDNNTEIFDYEVDND